MRISDWSSDVCSSDLIGANVFVGSNATLVAPLSLGEGAFVAAGSVVTQDVPADAPGVGRSRQTNQPGWADARQEERRVRKECGSPCKFRWSPSPKKKNRKTSKVSKQIRTQNRN